ncbi:MAG: asparagine synthase (glutamine-hydrolyzing) [Candidatus Dadabacteria bacterium]|nr:asparagine synthase (glutamine-hydrolyzing) [Candidatus Dadabacteria bacterium]
MCGITGIYSPKSAVDQSILSDMAKALCHRGPDDSGTYIDTRNDVGLGHTRLSIIDLSERGKQPMSNKAGTVTASYNGEIYNYREIRKELEQKGRVFVSDSDTEVLVQSYEEWGMECLHKFIGMFAFAVWDAQKQTLFLARDRAGVKPLYYYNENALFLFASELKSIMQHPRFSKRINMDGLSLFLRYNYIRSPHTIFENTFKLEPGTWMSVKNGEITKRRYWNIADYYNMPPHSGTEDEIAEELEKLLIDSFKYRLVSDVPVGLFLSGGIDSSIVAALLQKHVSTPIKTFTIGFQDKKYDEARYAREIAEYLGTDHTERYLLEDDMFDIAVKLPEIYDEPFGDISSIPTRLVSEIARRDVKVALSADGGDELFCGYGRYPSYMKRVSAFEELPPFLRNAADAGMSFLTGERFGSIMNITGIGRMKKFTRKYSKTRGAVIALNKGDKGAMFRSLRSEWNADEIERLLGKNPESKDDTFSEQFRAVEKNGVLAGMLATDFGVWLPDDILAKVDRAAMSVGLESREPLLDHRIAEFTARIPMEYKYRNGESKYILKKVLEKHLPRKLFDRKKVGFAPSGESFLRGKTLLLAREYLSPERVTRDGILNPDVISSEMNMFSRHGYNSGKIWSALVFQMWKEKWA